MLVGHFVGTNPEGFRSDPKKCVSIPSLWRHPVCAAAPSVRSDSHAMTNLFSMYEVRIICLWTWHHRLVNSCEATQAFGREAQRFPPLPPFLPLCFDFSIEKCHWSENPAWLSSPSVSSHRLHALKVLPSLSLRPFVLLASGTGVTSPSLPSFLTMAVLYFFLSCNSSCP